MVPPADDRPDEKDDNGADEAREPELDHLPDSPEETATPMGPGEESAPESGTPVEDAEGSKEGDQDQDDAGGDAEDADEAIDVPDAVNPTVSDPYAPDDETMPDPDEVSLKWPLLVLLAPIGILALGSLVRPDIFYDQFVFKYYWEPIKKDLGFNPINTASWAVLLGALLFLLDRIVKKVEQPMTFSVILAVVPYIVGGSIVRVMEDTKLFTEPLRFFLITPIIYVVIAAVAVIWLVIGHVLRKRSDDVGLDGALKALGVWLAAVWVGYSAWAFAGDDLVLFGPTDFAVTSSLVLLGCLAVPFVYFYKDAKRRDTFDQVGVMALFGTAFLLFAMYFAVLWHSGVQWGPKEGRESVLWVYIVMILAPAVFTWGVVAYARRWAAGDESWMTPYHRVMSVLIGLYIVYLGASAAGWFRFGDRNHDLVVWGGMALIVAPFVMNMLFGILPPVWTWLKTRQAEGEGGDGAEGTETTGARTRESFDDTPAEDDRTPWERLREGFLPFLVPVNLLLIFSQTMDGTQTALGIDQFGYVEKHVVPAGLIAWVEGSGVMPFADIPATVVMIPLKFAISLLVVWSIDVWAREDMVRYPNLVMLAKMAIIIVGLAPGVRDAVRLAMQV